MCSYAVYICFVLKLSHECYITSSMSWRQNYVCSMLELLLFIISTNIWLFFLLGNEDERNWARSRTIISIPLGRWNFFVNLPSLDEFLITTLPFANNKVTSKKKERPSEHYYYNNSMSFLVQLYRFVDRKCINAHIKVSSKLVTTLDIINEKKKIEYFFTISSHEVVELRHSNGEKRNI